MTTATADQSSKEDAEQIDSRWCRRIPRPNDGLHELGQNRCVGRKSAREIWRFQSKSSDVMICFTIGIGRDVYDRLGITSIL